MFLDEATIRVRGGRGGSGVVHFLSSRHNPRGGPDGGNGGPGGDVVLRATPSMSTLYSFRNRPLFAGRDGGSGARNRQNGAAGEELVVHVPVGTVVRGPDGEILADLALANDEVIVARGGEGGRGNCSFACSTRTTPRLRERGLPGDARLLRLELRLIADVGIIGYPNVGKSSLISAISGKRAKVADYPFTTLVPNLGVVDVDGRNQFVAVDVPGLVEGAHEGRGLGDRFLRHIERTRVLLHMVDLARLDGRDPLEDYHRINHELVSFAPALGARPQLVAGNKIDLISGEEAEALRERFAALGVELVPISVATMSGVRDVVQRVYRMLVEEREKELFAPAPLRRRVYQFHGETGFRVERDESGFRITGQEVETLARKLVLTSRDAEEYLRDRLEKMGVTKELRRLGYRAGDAVRIGEVGLAFELEE
ncbi:MAG: GTPase ObgE [Candidatus Bipolaricaulis sp.]|nr:GTPase ObgE [Candidatus Bipolaricaulis sp.]MDD5219075.1 GTPase ObgE [Candidatus Bipolaricaulis sp.]MDD5645628.1 GTPase ObgE [Candidatus Bipolaricaulis sp.]